MVESLTYCSVCFESYDSEEHVPLVLSCGHTYCQCCLHSMPEPLKCPLCRTIDERTMLELPRNILIFQIQSQLNPVNYSLCGHDEIVFYCKVCKFPICVECAVTHSEHGFVSVNDPNLETQIKEHLKYLEGQFTHKLQECNERMSQAEGLLPKYREEYETNRQTIKAKFARMREIVEREEQVFLEKIGNYYCSLITENQSSDNIREDVKIMADEDWLRSNLSKLGNVGLFNPHLKEIQVRRSQNVKSLNWKYSGRIDALSFMCSSKVSLTAIGVCTPYKPEKIATITDLKLLKGGTSRSEVIYWHSNYAYLYSDIVNGVAKICLETPVLIEPDQDYTLYLKIAGAKTFKCVDSATTLRSRDGTNFRFKTTVFVKGDETNRTDVQCGPIVDLYYTSADSS